MQWVITAENHFDGADAELQRSTATGRGQWKITIETSGSVVKGKGNGTFPLSKICHSKVNFFPAKKYREFLSVL